MMDQSPSLRIHKGVRFPYPFWFYPLRIVWVLVWATVWKVCWKRFPFGRLLILRIFGAAVDLRAEISGSAKIQFPWLVKAGSHIAIGPRVTLYNLDGIEIGNQVIISQDAYLCGGTHDYTLPTIPLVKKKIKIGRGAWIAAGAYIGPGVTIGEGAVVGARAVVVKDVEPWTVVAGNPARVLKTRIIQN